ncbi:acetyl-CoA carboxylase biotin carboxyl carrier protein [Lactobacillus porci]|uniref:acetyl-CoA carboxylase biotin carboxyl carrier protein n=1 Tax=Lactobacillus porci TaxID=2012477 RepID=UPI003993356F
MELTDVEKLIKSFEKSNIREMELDYDQLHLYLNKNKHFGQKERQAEPKEAAAAPVPAQEKAATAPAPAPASGDHAIKSPLVGTIYLQAKPGDAPFVTVGSHVKKGQVVCIVEAMKMMTEIKSTVSGTVSQVLVENEDLVECDQTLFTVKED